MDMDFDGDVDEKDDFIADMLMLEYLENDERQPALHAGCMPTTERGPSSCGIGALLTLIAMLCILANLFS